MRSRRGFSILNERLALWAYDFVLLEAVDEAVVEAVGDEGRPPQRLASRCVAVEEEVPREGVHRPLLIPRRAPALPAARCTSDFRSPFFLLFEFVLLNSIDASYSDQTQLGELLVSSAKYKTVRMLSR